MELWQMLFGSGVVVVAIINMITQLILWRSNRKAQQQDKAEEKEDAKETHDFNELKQCMDDGFTRLESKFTVIDEKQDKQCAALKASLGNTIEHLADKYICRGSITVDELSKLEELYEPYHLCGGNGTKTHLMERCHALPLCKAVVQEREETK